MCVQNLEHRDDVVIGSMERRSEFEAAHPARQKPCFLVPRPGAFNPVQVALVAKRYCLVVWRLRCGAAASLQMVGMRRTWFPASATWQQPDLVEMPRCRAFALLLCAWLLRRRPTLPEVRLRHWWLRNLVRHYAARSIRDIAKVAGKLRKGKLTEVVIPPPALPDHHNNDHRFQGCIRRDRFPMTTRA